MVKEPISPFKKTMTLPTPFSEGRSIPLTFVQGNGGNSADYKDENNVIFEVTLGDDGQWRVTYS